MTTGIPGDHLARFQGSLKSTNDRLYELERRLGVKQTALRRKEPIVPSVCVRRTTGAIIPESSGTGALTTMTWESARWDTHGLWDSGTSFVVPTGLGGLWSIGGHIQWNAATDGERLTQIRVNNVAILTDYRFPFLDRDVSGNERSGSNYLIVVNNISRDWRLKAGDTVTLLVRWRIFWDPGGTLEVMATNFTPEFWMTRRGP